MKKSVRMWLLVGILIIATFLRFYHLTTTPPGLYPDEAIDGNNAAEVAQTGHYQVFYTEDNGREGLYVNIIAFMFQFFHTPHEPWVVRLPAAVAGVLTVLGFYLLVAELFGNGPGLLASFLLATSFWHINFSRIGFRAILSPLFLIWTLYLLLRAFKTPLRRTAIWYAVSAGIVYALGFYTYIAYRVTPFLFLLFIPFFAKKYLDFWKRALLFIIVTFIVAAPIGYYFVKNPAAFFGRTSEISVTSASNPLRDFVVNVVETALMFNVHGDNNWRQNVAGAPELFFPVGLLFLLGIGLGFYSLWKRKKIFPAFGLVLTFSWIVLAALPPVLSDEGIPHALRSILMLPPALILATLGGVWLFGIMEKYGGGKLAWTIAVLFLISTAVFGYYDYFVVWAPNPNVASAFDANYVTIGEEINALPASTQKYVVDEAGGVTTRGIPMSAETTIFITNSFLVSQQEAKNLHYILPNQTSTIPPGAVVFYIQ